MSARRRGKKYSGRSKRSRANIDRIIARDGLNRQRALRDLAAGRWTPYARNKANRGPLNRALAKPLEESRHDLEDKFVANLDHFLGDRIKYDRQAISKRAKDPRTSLDELKFGASATEDELLEKADSRKRGTFNPFHYH